MLSDLGQQITIKRFDSTSNTMVTVCTGSGVYLASKVEDVDASQLPDTSNTATDQKTLMFTSIVSNAPQVGDIASSTQGDLQVFLVEEINPSGTSLAYKLSVR